MTTADNIREGNFSENIGPTRVVVGSSLSSELHPERNEDSHLIDQVNDVYAVFDGLGGHYGGDIASGIAASMVKERAGSISLDGFEAIESWFKETLQDINTSILQVSRDAATTTVIAKIHEHEGVLHASIGHVGDSRALIMHNGLLRMVTTDHTPFRKPGHTLEAMRQQEVLADVVDVEALSQDSLRKAFHQRNIIGACLGHDEEVTADIKHFIVEKGDIILLTSDGVHDNLTLQKMQQILAETDRRDIASCLTNAANRRSRLRGDHPRAKPDDITAVAITV